MTNGLQGDSSNGTRRVRIAGTGRSVPDRVLTNADLERIVDTSNDWIIARTGIEERRVASDEEYTSVFAVDAARKAMEMAGVEASDVDLVLISTVTPDMPFPATACLVQEELGAKDATAFDLNAGCTGFVYGLSVAHQYVSSGAASTALVIGAESLTKYTDYEDRSTCVLFGD
ncbi:MAG: 3-oxoacyl-ACP synthase, partial [Acidobacteriota bacterium]|nr:3-oxoacyl-ACP synthase [Acidobacteriota bacterium]